MASKYLQKYPVPQGFPEILHDFAKEILRDQPENIKEFGWQYFKALEEGTPFEYKKKGKAIPPPKDRKPNHQDYTYVEPSENAYKVETKPREEPPKQEQQEKPVQEDNVATQNQEQKEQKEQEQKEEALTEEKLKEHDQQQEPSRLREVSPGGRSQEEIDAGNYVDGLINRVQKQQDQMEEEEE